MSWKTFWMVTTGLIIFMTLFFTALAINPTADCIYGGHIDSPPKKNMFGATIATCNPAPGATK